MYIIVALYGNLLKGQKYIAVHARLSLFKVLYASMYVQSRISTFRYYFVLITGFLSWSRNAAICAGVSATLSILDDHTSINQVVSFGNVPE